MSVKLLKEGEEGFGILVESDAGFISREYEKNRLHLSEGLKGPIDLTQPIYYYCILQKFGTENRNGRIYPEDILKREVLKYMEIIKKNASFHELDHPESMVISLKGGSPHRIVELFWEGNALIGKLEILVSRGYRTSGIISCDGDLVAHYLEYGMTLGISSRGLGSLKKINGKNVVQDDFDLICFDIVSSPSTPGSYLYQNREDRAKYDEVLPATPAEEPQNSGSTSGSGGQEDLMNRLNKFLNFSK